MSKELTNTIETASNIKNINTVNTTGFRIVRSSFYDLVRFRFTGCFTGAFAAGFAVSVFFAGRK